MITLILKFIVLGFIFRTIFKLSEIVVSKLSDASEITNEKGLRPEWRAFYVYPGPPQSEIPDEIDLTNVI